MQLDFTNPDGVHDPGPYSHVAQSGDFMFISGQVPVDQEGHLVGEGDARAQAEQVFANLRACLAEKGVGMERIAKLTMFVVGRENLDAVRSVRDAFFPNKRYPASSLVFVAGLVDPKWLMEIEAIAVL